MNRNNPFFSVIIPTHNRPEFLPKAVKSVLNQKYQNFEIIIINDASVEDYTEVEAFLKTDSRISYFRVNNKNRSKTRNFGIDKAKGDWICFLDDDDIYYDNHLEVLHENIVGTDGKYNLYHTFSVARKKSNLLKHKPYSRKERGTVGLFESGIPPIHTVCTKRKILKDVKFDEQLHFFEDMDLWLRVIGDSKVYVIDKFTVEYRFHDDNSVNDNGLNSIKLRVYSLNKLFKYNGSYKWCKVKAKYHIILILLVLKKNPILLFTSSSVSMLIQSFRIFMIGSFYKTSTKKR